MLKHVLATGWTSVCPSAVCDLSDTRWCCIKTAEHIVMLSSPRDSPFVLVLCISRSLRNSNGVTPCGAAKQSWVQKCRNFLPISCYISETVACCVPWPTQPSILPRSVNINCLTSVKCSRSFFNCTALKNILLIIIIIINE